MKTGKSISALALEIERQATTRKDYLCQTNAIRMVPVEGDKADVQLTMQGNGTLDINGHAHRQLGEHVGVPAKYYDRMRTEAPALLAQNVNHWLDANPAKRLVRTLDGRARAFLSDGYRPLENADLCEVALPVLMKAGVEIVSCEVTESRLYIKAVDPRVVRQIGTKRVVDGKMVDFDAVCPSLCLSNSEVGMGALSVEVGMFTHACKNMAIFRESSLRKYHIGAKHELTANVAQLLTDRTKRITDAAIWSQVSDVIQGAFNDVNFEKNIQPVQAMTLDKIESDPVKVIELASKRFNFNEGEQKSVLRHLIEGADLTRYGLFNAITRTAEDAGDYDRATELERAGGGIIELNRSEWRQIAEAA